MKKWKPYDEQIEFSVGQRVRVNFKEIPPEERECDTGIITKIDTKFMATEELRRITFHVRLDEDRYYTKERFRPLVGSIKSKITVDQGKLEIE